MDSFFKKTSFSKDLAFPKLIENAKDLRKNMTSAEKVLWEALRNRKLNNWKFRRQHPFVAGFILDFYCAQTKVAIELDGSVHDEISQKEYDINRTCVLEEYGIRVIRFRNREITEELNDVLQKIIDFSQTPK